MGRYDVAAVIFDGQKRQISATSLSRDVKVCTFSESNSPNSHDFARIMLKAPPGEYVLRVITQDPESEKSFRKEEIVKLKDLTGKSVAISGVVMVDKPVMGPPEVSDVIFTDLRIPGKGIKEICAYFEVISDVDSSVHIESEVFDREGKEVFSGSYRRRMESGRLRECLSLGEEKFSLGNYSLRVVAITDKGKDKVEKSFRIKSLGEISGSMLDLAIEQLKYATSRDTIGGMLKASPKERKKLFEEFWKRRDPTPDTPENEVMEEYYNRISYANERFVSSSGKGGWETDMGSVYVIYGPPADVYNQPFAEENQGPYQIWYYYRIGRKFVFVDFMGFGEYMLVSADPTG
jgi:GWxTD domain-containing protein